VGQTDGGRTKTGAKGLEILSSDANIKFIKSIFVDNEADMVTPNLYLNRALNIEIIDSSFSNIDSVDSSKHQTKLKGHFISIIAESKVRITNSYFRNGFARQGGALYLLGDSSVSVLNSKFIDNFALKTGAAIYAESFSSIMIAQGCEFTSNIALNESGDAITAKNSLESLQIFDSRFYSTKFSNFIEVSDIQDVIIERSSFITSPTAKMSSTNLKKQSLPGLYLNEITRLFIRESVFKNLKSFTDQALGGALRIIQSEENKSSQNKFLITGSLFQNCTSTAGGAVAMINLGNAQIEKTSFLDNFASKTGGALQFFCDNFGKDFYKCSLRIADTVFSRNIA
jgi:predicted outer membrane repeat protein